MGLKRAIAELHYLRDNMAITPFENLDSNTQDTYCRIASQEIPSIISGYITNHSWFGKIIRGSIQEFINAHGVTLNRQNHNSLSKRIVAQVKATIKSGVE